jgi:hypothetical protein
LTFIIIEDITGDGPYELPDSNKVTSKKSLKYPLRMAILPLKTAF